MKFRPGELITVNSRKYNGTIQRSWQCEFVASDEGFVDLFGVFERAVEHPDLGVIEKGTKSHERFYLNRWYNYFRFESTEGSLRNYYLNICMPPIIGPGVVDYVDLDIDIIVWPDGRHETLDLQEFQTNELLYGYPPEIVSRSKETLEELIWTLKNTGPMAF